MALVVNGEVIDAEEVRREADTLRAQYYESIGPGDPVALEIQLREWARENVIERVLLRQEAARRQISLDALVEEVKKATPGLKNKEAAEYYRKHKEEMRAPELIHAAHIVRNVEEGTDEAAALETIQKVQAELNQGGKFEELADRYSDCPGSGGDLGWFPRGQMVPEFDDVVFALRPGQVSGIFRTVFGFHIARVIAHKPAGIPGFPDVQQHIEASLMAGKHQQAIEAFIDSLKARAVIEKRHESLLRT